MTTLSTTAFKEAMYEQGWRLNNLYWIINKRGRRIKFEMNWAQQELFERIWYSALVLKARQLGMSTVIQLIGLDNAVFTPNFSFGVIAHELEAAGDIYRRNIRFPYDNLPEQIRSKTTPKHATQLFLNLSNGSAIRVGTSLRSGTYQMLHVSEFGKICAKYPLKAQEIVTGSFETVPKNGIKCVESTAEGRAGYFFEYCQKALANRDAKNKLTPQDWRIFFFPWWKESEYQLSAKDAIKVVISPELSDYFTELEGKIDAELSHRQRAWYVTKLVNAMKNDHDLMKREYPSTEEEAFAASMEGSYYRKQLSQMRKRNQIARFLIEPSAAILTFWDLGIDDFTAIWLFQRVGRENRLVGYYENSGEAIKHYYDWLRKWCEKHSCVLGEYFLPHDVRQRSQKDGKSLEDTMLEMGMRPITVVDTPDLLGGITQTRNFMLSCYIHEEECAAGIMRLENYSKKPDEVNGGFMDRPKHDENSHGADALRMGAQGLAFQQAQQWASGDYMSNTSQFDDAYLPEPEAAF